MSRWVEENAICFPNVGSDWGFDYEIQFPFNPHTCKILICNQQTHILTHTLNIQHRSLGALQTRDVAAADNCSSSCLVSCAIKALRLFAPATITDAGVCVLSMVLCLVGLCTNGAAQRADVLKCHRRMRVRDNMCDATRRASGHVRGGFGRVRVCFRQLAVVRSVQLNTGSESEGAAYVSQFQLPFRLCDLSAAVFFAWSLCVCVCECLSDARCAIIGWFFVCKIKNIRMSVQITRKNTHTYKQTHTPQFPTPSVRSKDYAQCPCM